VFYSFDPVIHNANVIGGTTCMWNELGTKHTFDQKVLQKASVLSERLWNTGININGTGQLNNIATRLQAQADRLRARGYKIWPVTVELCEKNMGMCF
jgi:hexosaminidase